MTRWKITGIIATLVIIFSIPLYVVKEKSRRMATQTDRQAPAEFVGSDACRDCHQSEYDKWKGSHHQLAMAAASDETVLGDFAGAELRYFGVTSRFYKKDDRFMVTTQGPQGEMGDFEITHTFGWFPLQQYLIPFPGGRLQCLPIAWDSREKRWYHLYPDRPLAADDWLYWTNNGQNWNAMCAECHSTDLRKNYDPDTEHLRHRLVGNQRGLRSLPRSGIGSCGLGPTAGDGAAGRGQHGPAGKDQWTDLNQAGPAVCALPRPSHVP